MQLTLGQGKFIDFNKYVFIMARCCNYCRELPEATELLWGVLASCTDPTITDIVKT